MKFSPRFMILALISVLLLCIQALAPAKNEVSADRAYAHVEMLVSMGPRLAGSPAEAMAASYIENEFRSYGLDVWIENFIIENVEENLLSCNVVACLPGRSDDIIVVDAHHDSMPTPGAIDDASGVAVVLEIARVLSTENLGRTVLFTTFSGEELGLFGSTDFVGKHRDNKIVASITFDCIGAGPDNGLRIGLEGSTTEWLDAYAQQVAENMGYIYVKSERPEVIGGTSDHESFVGAGFDATWVYWVDPEREGDILGPVHTLDDNLDEIDKDKLKQVAELGVEVVIQLAGEDIAAWRHAHNFPIRAATFTIIGMGAVVLSIGTCSFIHYRRGWTWRKTAWIFSLVVGIVMVVAYLWLLT